MPLLCRMATATTQLTNEATKPINKHSSDEYFDKIIRFDVTMASTDGIGCVRPFGNE